MNSLSDNITILYKQYLSNRNDSNIIFNKFSDLIIERKAKNIGELLSLLTPKITSYNDDDNDNNFIEFIDNFSAHIFEKSPHDSVLILRIILESIQKLTQSKRLILTRFIWERQYFRKLISIYPKSTNGKSYMKESLFCSIVPSDGSLMKNLREIIFVFEPIIIDLDLSRDLINYINDIFNKNKGYTYADPTMIDKNTLSTMDFCVLCLNIVVEILKNIENCGKCIDKNLIDVFWNAVNVVYMTTHDMDTSIKFGIQLHKNRLNILDHVKEKNITQGVKMIETLVSYTSTIDTVFINRMIFNNNKFMDNLYETKNYDVIQRIISDLGNSSMELLIENSNTDKQTMKIYLSKFIIRILANEYVSVHIKFDSVKLILSHNLKYDLLNLSNGKELLINYIINDVDKLKYINHVHLIDLLIELSDTNIIESPELLELYMYLIPEFTDQYKKLIRIFLTTENNKTACIDDIRALKEFILILLQFLPVLDRIALSYIHDIFVLIETIINTDDIIKKIIEEEKINVQSIKDDIEIFNDLKIKYKTKVKPIIVNMFIKLQKKCDIIITKDSERILSKVIDLKTCSDVNGLNIGIIDSNDPSIIIIDVLDVIGYDIALNPYYFVTGDNIYHLIDRKTYFSIIRSKKNPFTREDITKELLDSLNNKDVIKNMRLDILKKINNVAFNSSQK